MDEPRSGAAALAAGQYAVIKHGDGEQRSHARPADDQLDRELGVDGKHGGGDGREAEGDRDDQVVLHVFLRGVGRDIHRRGQITSDHGIVEIDVLYHFHRS